MEGHLCDATLRPSDRRQTPTKAASSSPAQPVGEGRTGAPQLPMKKNAPDREPAPPGARSSKGPATGAPVAVIPMEDEFPVAVTS
jgi:hypothetical protein